ncbi:MAG: SEL1-like repeat protein, partial [Pseudomonadota bacterium]
PVAQFELAKALETGLGVAANTDEAVKWFRAAADQDFPDALNDLGFLTFQGGLGIARDPEAALAYFKRAAEMRHPEAAYNYGALIDDGLVEGLGSDASARYLFTALRAGNREAYDVLVNNASTFSRPTRRALQALLAERGFYTGAIDGLIGPQTTRGLAQALDGDA